VAAKHAPQPPRQRGIVAPNVKAAPNMHGIAANAHPAPQNAPVIAPLSWGSSSGQTMSIVSYSEYRLSWSAWQTFGMPWQDVSSASLSEKITPNLQDPSRKQGWSFSCIVFLHSWFSTCLQSGPSQHWSVDSRLPSISAFFCICSQSGVSPVFSIGTDDIVVTMQRKRIAVSIILGRRSYLALSSVAVLINGSTVW